MWSLNGAQRSCRVPIPELNSVHSLNCPGQHVRPTPNVPATRSKYPVFPWSLISVEKIPFFFVFLQTNFLLPGFQLNSTLGNFLPNLTRYSSVCLWVWWRGMLLGPPQGLLLQVFGKSPNASLSIPRDKFLWVDPWTSCTQPAEFLLCRGILGSSL